MQNWKPRLALGQTPPVTLEEYYDNAVSHVYGDSGICLHLSVIRSLISREDHVVELGVGGGDQSTIAILSARPKRLDSYDLNYPGSMEELHRLAQENDVPFVFHQEDTTKTQVYDHTVLFIDSWHDSLTVDLELARWTPQTSRLIIAHDLNSFGRRGQGGKTDTGITLSFGDFLFRHPEWHVAAFYEADNGLLVLERAN